MLPGAEMQLKASLLFLPRLVVLLSGSHSPSVRLSVCGPAGTCLYWKQTGLTSPGAARLKSLHDFSAPFSVFPRGGVCWGGLGGVDFH